MCRSTGGGYVAAALFPRRQMNLSVAIEADSLPAVRSAISYSCVPGSQELLGALWGRSYFCTLRKDIQGICQGRSLIPFCTYVDVAAALLVSSE